MRIEEFALSLTSGLNPRAVVHLLEVFGSAEAVFAASESELIARAEIREDIARRIVQREAFASAAKEERHCREQGIAVLASTDRDYPEPLRFINDYPHLIYMVGNNSLIRSRTLCAFVGERDSISSYGEKVTYRLLEQLADLVPEAIVVGALEGGVESLALRAARHFGLRCIGVTDSPLSQIAPQSCQHLAEEILDCGGLVLSETGIMSAPQQSEQVVHHRIVAGLCSGVVVVEGCKIPQIARYADGYSRALFAVPGRVTDAMSYGTNAMIANTMAQMVSTGREIVEHLGWE